MIYVMTSFIFQGLCKQSFLIICCYLIAIYSKFRVKLTLSGKTFYLKSILRSGKGSSNDLHCISLKLTISACLHTSALQLPICQLFFFFPVVNLLSCLYFRQSFFHSFLIPSDQDVLHLPSPETPLRPPLCGIVCFLDLTSLSF